MEVVSKLRQHCIRRIIETLEVQTADESKNPEKFNSEDGKEARERSYVMTKSDRDICNGKKIEKRYFEVEDRPLIINPKCHLVHHFDNYLTIGPHQIEVSYYWPLRAIFHDFFTVKEMSWMMSYSRPRLSAARLVPDEIEEGRKRDGVGLTVHKSVQTWFADILYDEKEMIKVSSEDPPYKSLPLKDRYNFTIQHITMNKISKRIEIATQLNLTTRHGSSNYQTTNYGLGGLVQMHMDPFGYEQGAKVPEERKNLVTTGDYIATFMGWLEDVELGGGTWFPTRGYEGILKPKKGSAAFWINLSSCHLKDYRSQHGGCPVLKGTKWIVNKWIYSWDQWKRWPCYMEISRSINPFTGIT